MTQYLLSVYQPDGPPPPREVPEKIMRDLDVVRQELVATNAWVFSGGLYPPTSATAQH
ncbi:MAG TPA: hypothetical protein VKE96_31825 [Vicinamibacterales bacterium]|nr:hypothetical protein [Vicinamibacterales bacterium]